MKVTIAKQDTFIPRWNGNEDLPPEEQIKVHYRYLTVQERQRYITRHPMEVKGSGDWTLKVETDDQAMFKAMTQQIENLEAEDETGKAIEVKTADDVLRARGLEGLYDEITTHYLQAQGVETKN